MPTVTGRLEGNLVTVLRDTGCSTVVVKRSLVPDAKLTGNTRIIRLLDRSEKCLPEADVFIDSPFFRGVARAVCMENPLYDVILGNIKGRLLQLIQQGQLSLEWVRLLVLDEADQLLGEGFQEDLRKLWALLPKRRQVVATSATYSPEVARILEEELLRNPMVVRLGADTPALLG
ncbi:hypothetical protein HPB52_020849 [Rhipicephalus sanguineus]|uniref:Helicase ATP-binding domain-containing protein n=1 Tax=Rhipicephalus sanguineus TaxID=34632 RepID=A0A9D4PPE5_RHISA|nr:hypothetical protein HPB52_020849 [Rhipicephalus sanguineus]